MNARSRRVLINRATSGLWVVSVTDLEHAADGRQWRKLQRIAEVPLDDVVAVAAAWFISFIEQVEDEAKQDELAGGQRQ